MNRRLLGACFVVLAMLAGAAQAVSPSRIVGNNIDPAVVTALAAGENPVDVIVTGLPHTGVNESMFRSRSEGMASLAANASPFFDAVRRVAADTGSIVRETWAAAPAIHLLATPEAIQRLGTMKEVRWVEHDAPDAVKVDPIVVDEAGGQNTGGRQMIQAEDIWALGYRGEGIKLSVIDTGIFPGHQAFKNADGSTRVIAWKDWVSGNPSPYDNNGHGTHVAGTAAGSRLYNDPSTGFNQEEGVAPRAQILVSKFLSAGGSGSWANGANSLQWSFDNGADITSNSWGGGCSTDAIAVVAITRTLTDMGMLSVFAAGNSGPGPNSILCPGKGESALTVGAVDQSRNIAGFSSRGPC